MRYTLSLALPVLISACSAGPPVVPHSGAHKGAGEHEIYVINHGLHTGLLVTAADIARRLPGVGGHYASADYVEFGWGDQAFYQAREPNSGLAAGALFWPTASVVHVVGIRGRIEQRFSDADLVRLCINERELASLVQFIAGSFYRDNQGRVVHAGDGHLADSRFYKAVGDYYLTNTCNTWTAKGLKSMGMDISTAFRISAGSVMNRLRQYQRRNNVENRRSLRRSCH